jgi:hypothetical protein
MSTQLTADARQSILDRKLLEAVSRGAEITSRSDFSAVLRYGQPVNHVLHLILSLLTFGIWLFVWLMVVVTHKRRVVFVVVDEFGGIIETTSP